MILLCWMRSTYTNTQTTVFNSCPAPQPVTLCRRSSPLLASVATFLFFISAVLKKCSLIFLLWLSCSPLSQNSLLKFNLSLQRLMPICLCMPSHRFQCVPNIQQIEATTKLTWLSEVVWAPVKLMGAQILTLSTQLLNHLSCEIFPSMPTLSAI